MSADLPPAPTHGALAEPSPWVLRFAATVPAGNVLDVAAGGGRHARLFTARGHDVVAVDRDTAALESLRAAGEDRLRVVCADLERSGWPFAAGRFAAVVVTNYLWRPLFDHLVAALAPRGVLLYETFARGHEKCGRPRNPDFLLRPGELRQICADRLRVVAHEQCELTVPRPAVVQRICAVNDLSARTSG